MLAVSWYTALPPSGLSRWVSASRSPAQASPHDAPTGAMSRCSGCSAFVRSKQIAKPAQIQKGEKQTPPLGRWGSGHLKGRKELLAAISADNLPCCVAIGLLTLLWHLLRPRKWLSIYQYDLVQSSQHPCYAGAALPTEQVHGTGGFLRTELASGGAKV